MMKQEYCRIRRKEESKVRKTKEKKRGIRSW
jgi:hypothetical protein